MYLIILEDGRVKIKNYIYKSSNKYKEIDIPKFVDYIQWYVDGEFEEVGTPVLAKKGIHNVKMLAGKRQASHTNLVASYLYGMESHGHILTGDVALVFEPMDYEIKECRIKPMSADQIRILLNEIKKVQALYYPNNDDFDIWG